MNPLSPLTVFVEEVSPPTATEAPTDEDAEKAAELESSVADC